MSKQDKMAQNLSVLSLRNRGRHAITGSPVSVGSHGDRNVLARTNSVVYAHYELC
jgi:hypothetical protein